mmetsp:Transcript_52763/g.107646  ORF Transcript_52763/g.107646 Transcript_52763/m.107646 type:complete len:363 (-) Transcript_52763:391-1479(-)
MDMMEEPTDVHYDDIPAELPVDVHQVNLRATASSRTSASQTETELGNGYKLDGLQISEAELTWHEKLGNGAMCEVYKVEWGGKLAAAKKLFSKFADDSQSKPFVDMVNEVNFVAKLGSHPNICEFFGWSKGSHDDPVLVMELIDGPTLEDFFDLYRKRNLKWRPKIATMYSWMWALLSALEFLHDRPVPLLHRDIKPANLVLTADRSSVKLVDFGVSRELSQEEQERTSSLKRQMTKLTGTARYMSPEVFDAKKSTYNEKSDVFAAALVMWEMCTGAKVFSNKGEGEYLQQQSFRDFNRPDITQVKWIAVREVITAAWELLPDNRPSARRLREQLEALPGCPPTGDPSPLTSQGCGTGCSVQ